MEKKLKKVKKKEKYKKIQIKKANSGTFRNNISFNLIEEKTLKYIGNKNSTINVLKNYLKYDGKYQFVN